MSDNWNFYALLVDDEPASIFVDLGVTKETHIADFPIMAYSRVRMNNPRPDGLSSQDEYDSLISLEKDVAEAAERAGKHLYVGRNTSSGNRDFYFYTQNHSIEDFLTKAMKKWPLYEYQTGHRPDEQWSTYWRFLYPSPEDFQRIGNRDVVDRLLEQGDRIEEPRTIDHFAVFGSQEDRNIFAEHLVAKGYAIVRKTDAASGEFQITFDMTDRPDQIDEVTIDLFRAARDIGGEYDGWGCTIVN
ncbi:DUF695 domain-containing protein [Sphingomonas bisphenolicum]|nr:DUF695 domain-containing protein [Sphingomonas bisphenolicum]